MIDSVINPDLTFDWLRANATGKGVQVAVIDSGIDPGHPELRDRVKRSCKVETIGTGEVVCNEIPVSESIDDFGHGTAVAGIITDIAPEAEIINVKVLNDYNACTGEVLIEGIRWALDQKIKLINMSMATIKEQYLPALFKLCEQAYAQDTILVVSQRNFGEIGWPAMFSSVISVAIGDFEKKFQIRYNNANLVECDAFGTRVRSLAPGGGYVEQTGTSFAAPHVTGFVALLLEQKPDLLPVEAKAVLKFFSTGSGCASVAQ